MPTTMSKAGWAIIEARDDVEGVEFQPTIPAPDRFCLGLPSRITHRHNVICRRVSEFCDSAGAKITLHPIYLCCSG